jgi:molybdopterin-binding protein
VDIGVKLAVIVTNQSLERFNLKEGKKVWLSFKASAVRFLKK